MPKTFEKILKISEGPLTMKGEFGKNVLQSSSPLPSLGKGLSFLIKRGSTGRGNASAVDDFSSIFLLKKNAVRRTQIRLKLRFSKLKYHKEIYCNFYRALFPFS